MSHSEFNESNYKRIAIINWLLAPAMLILFAWPYYLLTRFLSIDPLAAFIGSLLFAAPFTMTVLHGHVSMALGVLYRDTYYDWIKNKPLSYGILFHPIMFRTRFRLILLLCSFLLLAAEYYLRS